MALHVHSRYSYGTGRVVEIIEAGKKAGLDVLWLTDHDNRHAAKEPGAGYRDKLLFLVGMEITPPTNHYLALGEIDPVDSSLPFQEIIDGVRQQGGLGFVAHPEDSGNATARLPSYRWTDRAVYGFTGLEIWNHLSDWSRQIHHLMGGAWAAWHPFSGLEGAWPATLRLWDRLAMQGPVVGIGGADAHAAHVGRGPFRFTVFPYRTSFSAILNHVCLDTPLSSQWQEAQTQLLGAFKSGQVAVLNASLGSEKGFRFWLSDPEGRVWPMGSSVSWQNGLLLEGQSPVFVQWEIWRDGKIVEKVDGTALLRKIGQTGVWRVVLRRGRRQAVWLYSNPIYIA